MTHRFAAYIWCAGIVSLIVVAFPGIVVIGLFAGGIPGILLGIMPTLFMYSLLCWGLYTLIRKAVPRFIGIAAGALTLLIVGFSAVALPYTINGRLDSVVAQWQAGDTDRSTFSSLPPVVAVLNRDRSGRKLYCDTLCLRLLYNGAVSRVIVANGREANNAAAFRIERRDNCPEPAIGHSDEVWPGDLAGALPNHIRARVLARINAGECLLQDAGDVKDAGAKIFIGKVKAGTSIFSGPWTPWLDTVTATRLEIVQSDDRPLYRRTELTINPLTVPLVIETRAGILTSVTYAGWGRSEKKLSPIGINGRDALADLLGSAARLPDQPRP